LSEANDTTIGYWYFIVEDNSKPNGALAFQDVGPVKINF
jgi:hypothetical protein